MNKKNGSGRIFCDGCINDAPLYKAVSEYSEKTAARFHTPGHFGHGLFDLSYEFDVTEAKGLDALYEASGIIAEAEKRASAFFGSRATLFSAGGCTLCIQAMLSLAAERALKTKEIACGIFGRNCHRSAVFASALIGIDMVFADPVCGRITPDELEKDILEHHDCGFVYITSPDYFGRMSDIEGISAVCKKYGLPLLVDNAHGTHLILSEEKLHPLLLGADMTACSAHKTLPVLTSGAFLNIADEKFAENAKEKMALFGSSSPSYPVMISLDTARLWCEKNGKAAFLRGKQATERLKNTAKSRGFAFEDGPCDPLRLTLDAYSVGCSGEALGEYIRSFGIEPEYVSDRSAVFIIGLMHGDDEIELLNDAIKSFAAKKPIKKQPEGFVKGEKVMSVREALILSPSENVPAEESAGRVCAQIVCPCPPGIPVCIPGEVITDAAVSFMKNSGMHNVRVVV